MKILDLTMPIYEAPIYPGSVKARIFPNQTIEKDGVRVSNLVLTSHSGTHVDAPSHFIENAPTLEDIPLETFYGPATAINAEKPDLTKIRENDIVLVHSKNAGRSIEETKDKTGISLELALKLVELKAKLIGIDWFTVDFEPFTVHKTILSKNIPIVENLASVESLVDKRITACILPLRLGKIDGSPARAIALT